MPRKINYPGYQAGGGYDDLDEENERYYQELIKMREMGIGMPEYPSEEMGRASGGIIRLQHGGSLGRDLRGRRYRAGPEKLEEHAEEWRNQLEMDVLTGRKPSGEHPTIQFGGIYGSRAKHGGELERFTNEFGEPDVRYVPREGGPTIEDLYTRALDVDPQIHPDSVAYNLIKENDPAFYEELITALPAQPVWEENVLPPDATPADSSYSALMERLGVEPPSRRYGLPQRASGGIISLQEGGPAAFQSQVTSYGVPQQTAQQWANLTDRITSEGQRPYQQYGGQRLAGFTQPEAAAMAGKVAYGQGQGPMGTRQAASTLGQAGQMIGGAQQGLMGLQPQYARAGTGMRQTGARGEFQGQLAGAGMRTTGTAGQAQQNVLGAAAQQAGAAGAGTMRGIGTSMAGPEMQKGADLSQYMSQYTKGVTDPQLQQLMEFQKMQGQELGSQAAGAGAFGGLRQGVQATEQAKAASQQAADIIGQGQQQAFESAQQAFQADRAAQAAGLGQQLTAEQQAAGQEQQGLAAQRSAAQAGVGMSQAGQQQGFQAAHAGTQLGLQGQQAAMGALGAQGQLYGQAAGMGGQLAGVGGQQAALGQQQQQQQFERLRQMEAAGEKQRQLQQQSLGMGYQDWQNQMNQERANIGWQQSAMSGLPYQGAVTQSKYQPQTGPGASALSTGIGAMGLWNKYNQNQQQQGPQPQSSNAAWGGGSNSWTDRDEPAYNPNANQGNSWTDRDEPAYNTNQGNTL